MTTRTETARRVRARTAETPWGTARVVEEVKVAQRSGEKRFATVVQLLEPQSGEPLLRIAYTTDGVVRRGPVTLRVQDLGRLRRALEGRPALAAILGPGGGGA